MFSGKRWLPIATAVGLCMVLFLPTVARAAWSEGWFDDLDPAEWNKYDATVAILGDDVSEFYSPALPEGRASYEWRAEIDRVELYVDYGAIQVWVNVTSFFAKPGDFYDEALGEDAEPNVPFDIFSEAVNAEYPEGTHVLTVNLTHGVISDGDEYRLNTSITDATFGEFLENPVVGFRAHVLTGIRPAPVPEPATLAMFGTGAGLLGLIAWRRRRK